MGLRYDHAGHAADDLPSPRLNLVYQAGPRTWLRAGWGRFHQSQGIDQLAVGDGEATFHAAEWATHTIVGIEHMLTGEIQLRVEAYDKQPSSLRPEYGNWRNDIEIFAEPQPLGGCGCLVLQRTCLVFANALPHTTLSQLYRPDRP